MRELGGQGHSLVLGPQGGHGTAEGWPLHPARTDTNKCWQRRGQRWEGVGLPQAPVGALPSLHPRELKVLRETPTPPCSRQHYSHSGEVETVSLFNKMNG